MWDCPGCFLRAEIPKGNFTCHRDAFFGLLNSFFLFVKIEKVQGLKEGSYLIVKLVNQ